MNRFFKLTLLTVTIFIFATGIYAQGNPVSTAEMVLATVDQPLQFKNTSIGANDYQWDFGDGSPQESAPEPQHTFLTPGIYEVTLTVSNGDCDERISQKVEVAAPQTTALSLYPNPARSHSTIQFENNFEGTVLITLWNTEGKKMQHLSSEKAGGTFQYSMDLTPIPTGMYLVTVEYGDNSHTLKLIKQ